MKKEYKLWFTRIIIVFCIFSYQIALAENTKINYTDSEIKTILGKFLKTDARLAESVKAREKLDKDNDARYKQLQADLKSLSSSINSNIKSGFYCVQPTQYCSESTYDVIKAQATVSGMIPDAGRLAQCRAQIDEYNTKLQEYNKCWQDWIDNSIKSSAQSEYEAEQYRYKTYLLNQNSYCRDKEGLYSSYNEKTKECECVAGATFINGQCESKAQIQIDNYLGCVTNYGPLSKYNNEKDACECTEGSVFDFKKVSCVEGTVQEPYKEIHSTPQGSGYVPISELNKNTKSKNEFLNILKQEKPIQKNTEVQSEEIASGSNKIELIPAEISTNAVSVVQKPTFWQKFKKVIFKVKFW